MRGCAMSESIYGALTEDFIRRMRNWVKAKDGAPIAGGVSIYELGVGVDRYRESAETLLFGEALDTEQALRLVAPRYAEAVRQFWTYEGNSLRWHARRRQVEHRTFEGWVIEGHERLKAVLAEKSEAWRKYHQEARQAHAGA